VASAVVLDLSEDDDDDDASFPKLVAVAVTVRMCCFPFLRGLLVRGDMIRQ